MVKEQYKRFIEKHLSTKDIYDIYVFTEDDVKLKMLVSLLLKLGIKLNFLNKEFTIVGFTANINPQTLANLLDNKFLIDAYKKGESSVKEIAGRDKNVYFSSYSLDDFRGVNALKRIFNETDYAKILQMLGK